MPLPLITLMQFERHTYLRFGKHSHFEKILLEILILHIEPELIELEGSGFLGVEPDGALFAFTEFLASRFVDKKRPGERIHRIARLPADELYSRHDIPPLV